MLQGTCRGYRSGGVICALSVALCVAVPGRAYAEKTCDDYPYGDEINIEDVEGGTRIIATSSVAVDFDDVDAVNDARDEATISAKAKIVHFLEEGVCSDDEIDKAVATTKSMQVDTKSVQRDETKKKVKKLCNSASAVVRGFVPLASCLTPGKEMRVSVGYKPETLKQAEGVAGAIGNSINRTPPPGATSHGPSTADKATAPSADKPRATGPLNPAPGYSDTKNLDKF